MNEIQRWITPFCWLDTDHGLHFDIPALLWVMGVEDTPAHRENCTKMCREIMAKEFPNVPQVVTKEATN